MAASRPLRVLFVNPGHALGGAEHSLLLLLDALRRRGIDCAVAVFGDGPFRERVSGLGFPTTLVRVPGAIRRASRYQTSMRGLLGAVAAGAPAAWRIASVVRRDAIDLIHTNGPKAHVLGGLAGVLSAVPVVWHVRDFRPPGAAGTLFRRAARWLPSTIVTNSQAVADELFPLGPGRVPVVPIPNPVDLLRFRDSLPRDPLRQRLGLRAGHPLIGLVAHLTPWKGHDLFLTIARRVLDRVPDAHFLVAGGAIYESDGHAGYEDGLRSRAAALRLADRLTFLGASDDVAGVLASLDVLVHCPRAPEPFGRVLAEAMAVGRPVVAARAGGIPEVVADGLTGLLVAPGDEMAFTEAVVRLVEDPALRDRMGRAGRRVAEERFGIDAHVNRVLDVYDAVVGSARVAA